MSGQCPFSRRNFLAAAGGLGLLAAKAGLGSSLARAATPAVPTAAEQGDGRIEPFFGRHQGGIVTTQQRHTYFAAFDLIAPGRDDLVKMLRSWTEATARMTRGQTAAPVEADPGKPATDSGEAIGLSPARLTVTFGFGPGLFVKDGQDRYGLAAQRPAALVDLPKFNGDQLIEARTGGDLSIQACADDPQVAFHAVRQLARLASGAAQIRWVQTGFVPDDTQETPRNLMGFKDGTQNPKDLELEKAVWVGPEGPDWMRGGSYQVVRRIRIALEHWDGTEIDFQEQVIGRKKDSGAPLGGKGEFAPLDLDAADKDGNSVIPDNAHVRLAAAATNDGAQILRRGYAYNDGVNFISERWPPWRQGIEYDAGLLFVAYQNDPRTGFIRIFGNMAKLDALNQFVTHTGGGIFACPAGTMEGEFIGQKLFQPTG
jgi:deferrochelatase/peroxidase EfeB